MLNNWRRHEEEWFEGEQDAVFDAFSSAFSFTGWTRNQRGRPRDGFELLPVSAPRTGLLQSAWQWHGLIDPWEKPGPLR